MNADKTWIDEIAAVDAARLGLLGLGLDRDPGLTFAIRSGHPSTPLLVVRLDDPKKAYYLVPWMIAKGVVFVVQVDAASSEMLGATTFPETTPSPFLTLDEARTRVAREFPQHTFGDVRLVWRPCRESTSPIRPFYEFSYDQDVLYVDMDGGIVPELTPLGLGGSSRPQLV